MKKMIKKTIALLTLTVAVLGTSTTSLAASCLNVRDYGNHRYTERYFFVDKGYMYVTHTSGDIHLKLIREVWGVCVCGEAQKVSTRYIPCTKPN